MRTLQDPYKVVQSHRIILLYNIISSSRTNRVANRVCAGFNSKISQLGSREYCAADASDTWEKRESARVALRAAVFVIRCDLVKYS